jgi:hypothetical protein
MEQKTINTKIETRLEDVLSELHQQKFKNTQDWSKTPKD